MTETKIFYHVYECRDQKCFLAHNPQTVSQHIRALHLPGPDPREIVYCPGCNKPMVPHGSPLPAEGTVDPLWRAILQKQSPENPAIFKDGKFQQAAPGQPDQSEELDAEVKRGAYAVTA